MLTLSEAEIAEAGEMIAGRKRVPETATTIFKSVGMGLEDIAAAKLVYGLPRPGESAPERKRYLLPGGIASPKTWDRLTKAWCRRY